VVLEALVNTLPHFLLLVFRGILEEVAEEVDILAAALEGLEALAAEVEERRWWCWSKPLKLGQLSRREKRR
jgi:hypothetical protein